jgi:hypothetical protein
MFSVAGCDSRVERVESHCWAIVRGSEWVLGGVFGSWIMCGFPPVNVVAILERFVYSVGCSQWRWTLRWYSFSRNKGIVLRRTMVPSPVLYPLPPSISPFYRSFLATQASPTVYLRERGVTNVTTDSSPKYVGRSGKWLPRLSRQVGRADCRPKGKIWRSLLDYFSMWYIQALLLFVDTPQGCLYLFSL